MTAIGLEAFVGGENSMPASITSSLACTYTTCSGNFPGIGISGRGGILSRMAIAAITAMPAKPTKPKTSFRVMSGWDTDTELRWLRFEPFRPGRPVMAADPNDD